MTQTSKCTFALLVTCLILISPVVAQIKANYHFGVIGAIGDTTVRLSEPVIIEYSKCFEVTNGVPKFSQPKSGAFAITCNAVQEKVEPLMVHAYPNPVISQLTIRSLVSFPEKGLVKYTVVIADMMGNLLKEIKTDVTKINAGFTIPVSDMPMGYFVVTLYANKDRIQSFKILKGK